MSKMILDDNDFEEISFHDNIIHAMTFDPDDSEFLLDIDYITKWIHPKDKDTFSFIVATATLVFKDIYNLNIDILVKNIHTFDISEIKRQLEPERKGVKVDIYNYEIVLNHVGEITFSSTGFKLYLRKIYPESDALGLTRKERNGISFDKYANNT